MHHAPSLARALVACATLTWLPGPITGQAAGQPAVEARTIDPSVFTRFGELSVLRPSRDSIMGFQQPTKIAEIAARGGQEVRAGQLLLRGDDAEDVHLERMQKVRAESTVPVDGAKAEMEQAEHEAQMMRDARQLDGASAPEVRRAELVATVKRYQYSAAIEQHTQEVIQHERMKVRVERFRIQAPFDGIVDVVMGDVGQAVAENEKLVRVVNIDQLWIDVGAKTSDPRTLALKEGDQAWVLLDVAGTPVLRQGKVIEAAPTADLASRTRRIRVEIPNPKGEGRMIAGGPAWVRFTPPPPDLLQSLNLPANPLATSGK
jgi:multidrug efflux pump subunit AcrA (membrane-fusion protein)